MISPKNGNVGIGTTGPAGKVQIVAASSTGNNGTWNPANLVISNSGGANVGGLGFGWNGTSNYGWVEAAIPNTSYNNIVLNPGGGNVGIGTTNPTLGPLQMGSGAYVTSGGVWTNASSRAYKQDIAPLGLDKAMKTLTGLQPVTFRYKRAPDEQDVGFISEDVPKLVVTKDRTGLSAMDIVAVLTNVVQQQQKELETLKQEMSRLKRAL